MIVYEFIKFQRAMLEQMVSMSVKPSDVKYLELYKDYIRLTGEGHKKTYIMQYLSDEYGVDERTIYRIVNRFSAEVEV